MSLRLQVLLFMTVVVTVSVAVIGGTLVLRLRSDFDQELAQWSDTVRQQLVDRGKAVTNNTALSAAQALETRDFLYLAELVKTATTQDPDIASGYLADKNGRILVHTNPKETGKILKVEDYKAAVNELKPVVRDVTIEGKPAVEVVAPVLVGGFVWGTLHFDLSPERLESAMQDARGSLGRSVRDATSATGATAGVLVALAALLGVLAASRITSPLRKLTQDFERIRRGDRSVVRASGCREFMLFGMGVNELTNQDVRAEQALKSNVEALTKELAAAQHEAKTKDEFLANVSHELGTPLNAILTVPKSLVRDYQKMDVWVCSNCSSVFEPEPGAKATQFCPDCHIPMKMDNRLVFSGDASEHAHFLGRVKYASDHMRRIVQSFVDYSKLSTAELLPNLETVKVNELVEQARSLIAPLAAEKNVTLEVPAVNPAATLNADRTMLSQVLVNLLGNAVKFTPNGGSVKLELASGRDPKGAFIVQFRVRDSGIGIPKDKLELVFEAFYQVEGGHTRAHGGTGLGLSITRKLVELHKGRIWAESEGANKGSVFTFELPLPQRNEA